MTDAAVTPMVSVVLTTYNHEPYIEQAIRSAAEQQVDFPIEILVGEDGSPDGTRAVCERLAAEFPDRVKLYCHDPNIGGHDNFNFLWTRARGRYIAWLEGDDYWTDPLKLQTQVEAMERTPEASFCFHNTLVFTPGEPEEQGFLLPDYKEEMLLPFANLVFSNRIMTCSTLYRRGLVPELPAWVWPLKIGDWPMHLMHAAQGPALFLPRAMAAYRRHPTGGWTSRPLLDQLQIAVQALEAVYQHVPPPLQLLCNESIRAFQHWMDAVRKQDEIDRLNGELAERDAALDHARAAEAQARASEAQARAEAIELASRAPPWRQAWRRVWRPIYRFYRGLKTV